MFEPGQKVIVTKSSIKGKTGPRVGSVGFISYINLNPFGVYFDRITWYRYGFEKKERVETHHFLIPRDNEQLAPAMNRIRAQGQLEPVKGYSNINFMSDKEFSCWLHASLRLMPHTPFGDSTRASVGILPGSFNPNERGSRRTRGIRWDRNRDRKDYAAVANRIKVEHIKQVNVKTKNELRRCGEIVRRWYDRYGYEPGRMAAKVLSGGDRHAFDMLFFKLKYLNMFDVEVFKEIHTDLYFSTMYREWLVREERYR